MIQAIEARAETMGIKKITLRSIARSIKFYESQGFKIVVEGSNKMEKSLVKATNLASEFLPKAA